VATLKHTTLATARLRFLFLAAKIWRHAGRVGVSYSDHYAEPRNRSAVDGPIAGDYERRAPVPPRAGDSVAGIVGLHRILCTRSGRESTI
jgi:hypothetical protein